MGRVAQIGNVVVLLLLDDNRWDEEEMDVSGGMIVL